MAEAAALNLSTAGVEGSLKRTLSNPITFTLALVVMFLTAHTMYQVRRKGKTVKGALIDDAKLLATPTAIVAILGFVTGLGEAIIFQNLKVYGLKEGLKSGSLFSIPDKKEFTQTVMVLIVTSILTGLLTDLTLRMLPKEEPAPEKKAA